MSRLGLGETRRDIPTVPTQSDKTQGRHARRARTPFGRPLRFAPWPAVGPGPDVAELRRARTCCVYDVFCCCPSDRTCPLHPV